MDNERFQEIKDFYRIYKDAELRTYEHDKCFIHFFELIAALEASQQQLVENEIRLRIAGDDIAKLRETIADYQSLLKEG